MPLIIKPVPLTKSLNPSLFLTTDTLSAWAKSMVVVNKKRTHVCKDFFILLFFKGLQKFFCYMNQYLIFSFLYLWRMSSCFFSSLLKILISFMPVFKKRSSAALPNDPVPPVMSRVWFFMSRGLDTGAPGQLRLRKSVPHKDCLCSIEGVGLCLKVGIAFPCGPSSSGKRGGFRPGSLF